MLADARTRKRRNGVMLERLSIKQAGLRNVSDTMQAEAAAQSPQPV